MMKSRTTLVALCLLAVFPGAARAQNCPENAYLAETIETADTIRHVCRCLEGYEKQGGKCVPAGQRPEISDGVVDPRWFAMPGEAAQLQVRLEALAQQRAFLERERDLLKGIEGGLHQLLVENVTASRELMQDAQSQTLDVLDGLFAMASPSSRLGRVVGKALPACQAYYYYRAYASAKDEKRAREKMTEAVGALKNVAVAISPLSREAEAVKSATDAVVKIHRIIDRTRRGGEDSNLRANLEDAHGALIDTIQAVDEKVGGALKAGSGSPVLVQAAYALGRLEQDRLEMENALYRNTTALRSYEERLAKVAQDEAFYTERLAHTVQ